MSLLPEGGMQPIRVISDGRTPVLGHAASAGETPAGATPLSIITGERDRAKLAKIHHLLERGLENWKNKVIGECGLAHLVEEALRIAAEETA